VPSRRTAALLVGVLVAAVPAGVVLWRRHERERNAREQRSAAVAFAEAWQGGRLAALSYAGSSGQDVATGTLRITSPLTVAATDAPTRVSVRSVQRGEAPGPATARLAVTWTLRGGVAWSYDTVLPLRSSGGRWLPAWSAAVVAPQLAAGQVLQVDRQQPPRADILGAGDTVLVTRRPVVRVGIEPRRVDDAGAAARAVARIVDVDAAALAKRVAAAKPDAFVEVITLRRSAYDDVRDRLRAIDGAVFAEAELPLAPSAHFARALIGSVGEATRQLVEASEGRLLAGDQAGLSGLQAAYDERLAGTPGVTVRATTPAGERESVPDATVFEQPARPGQALRLTLDPRVQRAAEAALATAPEPAGLVAVRAGTGEVLAVANGGPNAAGYNRAMLGQYPPGSTFKVVSALALLERGLRPQEQVRCPPTVTVNGKEFRNAEDEVLGSVPFHSDFAHSCNTAFVGSAERVSTEQLSAAASALGYGAGGALGVPAYAGDVPTTADAVEHAAAMIGQGKVLSSPLTVATVSASVVGGRMAQPTLVRDPEPEGAGRDGAELPPGPLRALRAMMREVVTDGTGTALRGVPGGAVHGKTGTAEYGAGDPPATHAWFTGYQGDVAFAVVVEDGGFGAETAAPRAADFLRRLAG
jgi:cell division protein FtsI/penicillin-binding protein 2